MAVIVVTRLRLKDPALLDAFFTDALTAIEQAQKSEGNLGVDTLAEANNAWWTVTAWQERRLMHSYVRTDPHRSIQSHLDRYCDEATFVDWEQDSPDLPDWPTNWRTWSPTARRPSSPSRQPPIRPATSRPRWCHRPRRRRPGKAACAGSSAGRRGGTPGRRGRSGGP